MATYPTDVKIFIDGNDVTKLIFGTDVVTLTNVENTWRKIDISTYLRGEGMHVLEVTAGGGTGRVEARLEIS